MNGVKDKGNRLYSLMVTVLICAIVGIILVVVVYYLFFSVGNNVVDDNQMIIYSYEVNDDRVNILLKHIDLMLDPKSDDNTSTYALYNDLSDDTKLYIALEDLILTNNYTMDDDKISIKLDDVLARMLALYNLKQYDYYPDFVDFKNYHFEKKNGYYIGNKTMSDEEYGSYVYEGSFFSIGNYELYVQAKVGYFQNNKGAYFNSSKNYEYCSGKDCGLTMNKEDIEYREIHATYKIFNNQFIIQSLTVSKIN